MPMPGSRSVTGWPHHLQMQICRAPAVQGGPQNHPGLGQHQGGMPLRTHRGCGATRKAAALPAVSCGSVTRHLQCSARPYFRELSRQAARKSAVTKPCRKRTGGALPPTPTLSLYRASKVPKPKSSRRTVVNRVTSGCESRRNRACGGQQAHGSILSSTRKIANPRRLGRRDTRSVTGVPDHFPPLSSGAERVTSNHRVAGAIPAGEIFNYAANPRCRNSSRA